MAAAAPRTTDPDLTPSASAGLGAVHGLAGLAGGERIRVVDEDSAALEAEVLAAHLDGFAELQVHRHRGKEPARAHAGTRPVERAATRRLELLRQTAMIIDAELGSLERLLLGSTAAVRRWPTPTST